MAANAATAETDPPSASILYSKDETKISTLRRKRLADKSIFAMIQEQSFFYMKENFYFMAEREREREREREKERTKVRRKY